ncbi:hypothetical protein SAMN04487996_10235 [Dyadobacter soli]|uniref:Uncharacterized protein n=1 Tax=Dyadobacter soli TaxID=659014 RepID=A0A1G6X2Z5_9BACT|nr:hypothetical protein SAMN04487996_10235 [Dyadobacter soli]
MIDGSKLGSQTSTGNQDNAQIGQTGPEMDNAPTEIYNGLLLIRKVE